MTTWNFEPQIFDDLDFFTEEDIKELETIYNDFVEHAKQSDIDNGIETENTFNSNKLYSRFKNLALEYFESHLNEFDKLSSFQKYYQDSVDSPAYEGSKNAKYLIYHELFDDAVTDNTAWPKYMQDKNITIPNEDYS